MYTYKYNLSFGTSFCVTSTSMAGTVKDMSLIKQVLQFQTAGRIKPWRKPQATNRYGDSQ